MVNINFELVENPQFPWYEMRLLETGSKSRLFS